jgi:hypothetical protein
VQGNLTIAGGTVEFEGGTERDADAPPWDIYHLEGTEKQPVGEGGALADVQIEELRIEMPAPQPGGVTGNNRVMIGTWSKHIDATGQEKEEFHACLTIRDDCTVEVGGNLVVKGQITAGTIVGGRLTDAARNAAASALTSGILATSARLGEDPGTLRLGGTARSGVSIDAFVTRLEQDANFRNAFVERMKDSALLTVTDISS